MRACTGCSCMRACTGCSCNRRAGDRRRSERMRGTLSRAHGRGSVTLVCVPWNRSSRRRAPKVCAARGVGGMACACVRASESGLSINAHGGRVIHAFVVPHSPKRACGRCSGAASMRRARRQACSEPQPRRNRIIGVSLICPYLRVSCFLLAHDASRARVPGGPVDGWMCHAGVRACVHTRSTSVHTRSTSVTSRRSHTSASMRETHAAPPKRAGASSSALFWTRLACAPANERRETGASWVPLAGTDGGGSRFVRAGASGQLE